jgi:hypothetical protein
MLLKAKKLQKMFKGLDEETSSDLDIVRLNAYRSHFQLSVITATEENKDIEVENVDIVEEADENEVFEEDFKDEIVEMDTVIYEEPIDEEVVEE